MLVPHCSSQEYRAAQLEPGNAFAIHLPVPSKRVSRESRLLQWLTRLVALLVQACAPPCPAPPSSRYAQTCKHHNERMQHNPCASAALRPYQSKLVCFSTDKSAILQ